MNSKNFAIRMISVLLCTIMLVGMIPFSVSATTKPPIVRYMEDFKCSDGKTVDVPQTLKSANAVTQSIDSDTGILTIKITKAKTVTANDRFKLELKDKDISVNEYPFIAVGYTTANYTMSQFNFNITTDKDTSDNSRMWAATKPNVYTGVGNIQKLVIDVKNDYSGRYAGAVSGDTTHYRRFEFPVRNGAGDTRGTETFQFQYIAFFATKKEAEDFVYQGTAKMTIAGNTVEARPGTEFTLPEAPVVPYKKFLHYYDVTDETKQYAVGEEIEVVDGLVLEAEYEDATEFTVKYHYEGEVIKEIVVAPGAQLRYDEHVKIGVDIPVPDGEVFEGWFHAGNKVEYRSEVDRDLDLVVNFDSKNKTVTYKVDGSVSGTQEYEKGAYLNPLPFNKSDAEYRYEFLGWKNEEDGSVVNSYTKVEKDLVVYADYAKYSKPDPNQKANFVLLMIFNKMMEKKHGKVDKVPSGPVAVFNADSLSGSAGSGGVKAKVVSEGGKKYVRFSVDAAVTATDNTRANVIVDASKAAGVKLSRANVIVIGYRTNAQIKNVDVNPTFVNGEKTARIWGCRLSSANDQTWQKLVFDAKAQNWTGGENGVVGTDAASRFESVASMAVKGLCLKPFQNKGSTINAGSYFDVEYVAYFNNMEDARAYVYR